MFGGAFNPPTKAHIELADAARRAADREKVVFVPSKQSYIRDDQKKDFAFTDGQRLGMLKDIAAERDWMLVDDYELREEKQPRSYQTLCYLREKGIRCSLLFGSDKLPELKTGWLHIEEIGREFGFVVMTRAGDDCRRMIEEDEYLSSLSKYITLVDTPEIYRDYSSTEVRRLLKNGGDPQKLKDMLPEELGSLKKYLNGENE